MIATVINIATDESFTINDIELVNYVANRIILVNKAGDTFTYMSQVYVISIAYRKGERYDM